VTVLPSSVSTTSECWTGNSLVVGSTIPCFDSTTRPLIGRLVAVSPPAAHGDAGNLADAEAQGHLQYGVSEVRVLDRERRGRRGRDLVRGRPVVPEERADDHRRELFL